MTPGGSVLVGMAAGALSVCGYVFVTPALDRLLDLKDICGVHNLSGMPAVLGGLVAGFASLTQSSGYLNYDLGITQLGYQIAAMGATLAIAVTGGAIVGFLLSLPYGGPSLTPTEMFDDAAFWLGVDVEATAAPSKAPLEPKASVQARSTHSPSPVQSSFTAVMMAASPRETSPSAGGSVVVRRLGGSASPCKDGDVDLLSVLHKNHDRHHERHHHGL